MWCPDERETGRSMRKEDMRGQSVGGKAGVMTEGEGRSQELRRADQQQKVKKARKRILCSEPPEEPALRSPSPEPGATEFRPPTSRTLKRISACCVKPPRLGQRAPAAAGRAVLCSQQPSVWWSPRLSCASLPWPFSAVPAACDAPSLPPSPLPSPLEPPFAWPDPWARPHPGQECGGPHTGARLRGLPARLWLPRPHALSPAWALPPCATAKCLSPRLCRKGSSPLYFPVFHRGS